MRTSEGNRSAGMLAGAVFAMLALASGACSKPCENGESRCEGASLRTCGHACEDCDIDWLPAVACAGACITEGDRAAFCSLTENPEPLCADRAGYCAADVQVRCRSGYPVSQLRCEPPIVPGQAKCVELPSGLACSTSGPGPALDAGTRDGA